MGRPSCAAFVLPHQLPGLNSTALASRSRFRPNSKHSRPHHRFHACAQKARAARSSTALHRTDLEADASSRYIDLRTMQVVSADEAHIRAGADAAKPGFAPLSNVEQPPDSPALRRVFETLFTADTIPLSETQRAVVYALLSHRSTMFTVVAGDETEPILLDLVMRNRVWKESIIYCAASRRAAETIFISLCAQLGPERRNEVVLNFGDGAPRSIDPDSQNSNNTRVIITCPSVLRKAIVNNESSIDAWATSASLLFIDHLSDSNLCDWEEVLLSLPSKVLVCALTRELNRMERDFLPLWMETIQNTVVPISPPGASSLLARIEQPQNFPLLRTFAFNAALHESPVQVSLTILKEMMVKEIERANEDFVPDYAESFLQGITMIPADNPADLLFETAQEAEFADVAALITADAKRIEESMRSKSRRRSKTKRKERTPASRAAARRRRESAYANALLLPAIVMVQGHVRAEDAATGIRSALGDSAELLWDEDTSDHVEDIVESFKSQFKEQLTNSDERVLDLLTHGIGVVHERYTPSVRIIVEELFRGGFIPVLIADSHLGSTELCALPSSKSVLVDSEVLATCDDETKGLIVASTPVALAGRVGKDDVGNLIMMWYHESIDDGTAGHEIASNLLLPVLSSQSLQSHEQRAKSQTSGKGFEQALGTQESIEQRRGTQSILSTTYDNVLRSVRRFGIDGYESIAEYSLDAFKQWAERGAIHATIEKMSVEKKAINESFGEEDWAAIAQYSRDAAKVNEAERVLKAMTSKFETIRSRRILEELKASRPGRIIGVQTKAGVSSGGKDKQLPASSEEESKSSDADDSSTGSEDSTQKGSLTTKDVQMKKTVAATFVCVFDQEGEGSTLNDVDYRYLAACVLADGVWTMVPLSDVTTLAAESDVISNVDLLEMPHPATFDIDPETTWAKCAPFDAGEQSALHRVSDELIARMAADDRPSLTVMQVAEFEAQRDLVDQAQDELKLSPWHGREDEMNELRRMRRRSAELTDEIKALQTRKEQFERELMDKHNDLRSVQTSLMAVLEDCHAVGFVGERAMEMTPIGALASVLPCKYPVFAGACLSLIDDIETLNAPGFAAFVALLVCYERALSNFGARDDAAERDDVDEPFDLTPISNGSAAFREHDEAGTAADGAAGVEADAGVFGVRLQGILPTGVRNSVVEIQRALHQLHQRHVGDCQAAQRVPVPEIVPQILSNRLSEAVYKFADGATWRDVVDDVDNLAAHTVDEIRRVCDVLHVIRDDDVCGEFSERTQALALEALTALDRWPVRDMGVMRDLLESGVVERHWAGNTYDKWWRSARDELTQSKPEATGAETQGS